MSIKGTKTEAYERNMMKTIIPRPLFIRFLTLYLVESKVQKKLSQLQGNLQEYLVESKVQKKLRQLQGKL